MSNLNKLTTNQAAYLTRAMTTGGGLIELGELAKGLGKQKGNVVRKLESMFPNEHLFNLKSSYLQSVGNGGNREVSTYMLDHKTAAALAMSYDGMLGIEVLTILEEALQTIGAMTKAVQEGDTQAALQASLSFSERMRSRTEYLESDSENATRSKALKRLNRGGK